MELSFDSIASLVAAAESEGRPLSALVLEQQAAQLERSEADVYETMHASYEVMRTAAAEGLKPGVRSASGLTGGDARRLHEHLQTNGSLIGGLLPQAMATALAVSEWNAAMGRIVAAPTAGSCGILPRRAADDGNGARRAAARVRDEPVHRGGRGHGDRRERQRVGRAGRMPGGVRLRQRHGRRRIGGAGRRHARSDGPRRGPSR